MQDEGKSSMSVDSSRDDDTLAKNGSDSDLSSFYSRLPTNKKFKRHRKWNCLSEYTQNSSIHGLKYLNDNRIHWVEKIWWIIMFVLSIYGCSRLIFNIWHKWNSSPVIVSFDEKSTPVWKIPFPTVTICPETKAVKGVLDYTEAFHSVFKNRPETVNLTIEMQQRLEAISHICEPTIMLNENVGGKTTDSTCVEHLIEMAPKFKEMFDQCEWRNFKYNCSELFTEILTEEGICFSFNILNSSEIFKDEAIHFEYNYLMHNKSSQHQWTFENGYANNASTMSSYPVRVLGAGPRAGLFLQLRLNNNDLDYICRGPVQGFKILLSTPGEIPQMTTEYFRVPLNQEVVVSVKPNMMTTSDGLRDYAPKRRQCFFSEEKYLRYFKIYTQKNCLLECISNYTLSKCGCVKFSMPRNSKTPICGAANIVCYNQAADELLKREIAEGLSDFTESDTGSSSQCNCLPSCTSISYNAEISQASVHWKEILDSLKIKIDKYQGSQMAHLLIYFKENQFITSKRSELYGTTDLIANCGGLLALFMGISLLSLIEIIYFCTIRLYHNLHNKKV